MRLRTLTSAGIAIALAATLAACGGDDDKDSAATTSESQAPSDNSAPGTGDDAYKSDDKFVPGNNKISDIPAKTIIYADFKILPSKITAKAGEEWTEDNQDVATHNLTEDKGAKQKNGDIAPDVMAGEKAKFKMPSKKGKYKVVCYYHQNMTATVTVN